MRALRWAFLAIAILVMISVIGYRSAAQPVLATAKFADGTVLECLGYTYGPPHRQVTGNALPYWAASALPRTCAESLGIWIEEVSPEPLDTPVLWLRVRPMSHFPPDYLGWVAITDGHGGKVIVEQLKADGHAAYPIAASPGGQSHFTLMWKKTDPRLRMVVPSMTRTPSPPGSFAKPILEARLDDGTRVKVSDLISQSSTSPGYGTSLTVSVQGPGGKPPIWYPWVITLHDEYGNRYGPFGGTPPSTYEDTTTCAYGGFDSLFAGPDLYEVRVPLRRTRSSRAQKGVEWTTPLIDIPIDPEAKDGKAPVIETFPLRDGQILLEQPLMWTDGNVAVTLRFTGLESEPGAVLKRCVDADGREYRVSPPLWMDPGDGLPFTIDSAAKGKQVRFTFEFTPAEVAVLRVPVKRIGYK